MSQPVIKLRANDNATIFCALCDDSTPTKFISRELSKEKRRSDLIGQLGNHIQSDHSDDLISLQAASIHAQQIVAELLFFSQCIDGANNEIEEYGKRRFDKLMELLGYDEDEDKDEDEDEGNSKDSENSKIEEKSEKANEDTPLTTA